MEKVTTQQQYDSDGILRIRMLRPLASLLIAVTSLAIVSCSTSKADPRGVRVGVRGMVLLDEQPLLQGRILFVSTGGGAAVKATGTIQEGVYKIAPENGPLVGKSRVEIYPEMIELEELEATRGEDLHRASKFNSADIPVRYNLETKLVVEIDEQNENEFDFEIESDVDR